MNFAGYNYKLIYVQFVIVFGDFLDTLLEFTVVNSNVDCLYLFNGKLSEIKKFRREFDIKNIAHRGHI